MLNSFLCSRTFLLFVLLSAAGLANSPMVKALNTPSPQTKGDQSPGDTQVDNLVQAAYRAYNDGKLDEALANCTKAIALNPNDFRPHAIAGLAHAGKWKMKSASTEFASAIRLKPDWKEGYVLKAKADISLGAVDEAIAGCRKALELDPKFAEAYATIGEALEHNEKREAEAIAAYQTALKIDPKLFRAYDSLGQLFLNQNNEKSAEEIFRQGMAADPTHMSGRFQLGRLFVKQGKLIQARQLWIDRSSDEDRIQPAFIDLLRRAENMKDATEHLAKSPDDPEALNEMGLAVLDGEGWVIDGRQERAIVYFRKALQLRPKFAQAQYNIVKAMIQYTEQSGKDKRKVDQELAKLRQLDPKLAAEMDQYRKTYQGVPDVKQTTRGVDDTPK
jgi:tetratricopeptide (TPR) repeat protein